MKGTSGDAVQMGCMSCFAPLGKQPEILQDIVLCVCSHPSTIARKLAHDGNEGAPRRQTNAGDTQRAGAGECEGCLPYLVIHRLHHPGFGLANGGFQALRLTVTSHGRRGTAYSAVRVHPDDGLPGLVRKLAGIHGLSGRRGWRRGRQGERHEV